MQEATPLWGSLAPAWGIGIGVPRTPSGPFLSLPKVSRPQGQLAGASTRPISIHVPLCPEPFQDLDLLSCPDL